MIKKYSNHIILFLVLTACFSCQEKKGINGSSNGLVYQEMAAKDIIIEYSKSPCFGTCPYFDFIVYNDLTASYKGKKFVDSIGDYSTSITQSQLTDILEIADMIKFFELEKEYDNKMIMDLPATLLKIKTDTKEHQVVNRYDGPKELKSLYLELDEILKLVELVKI